MAQISPRPNHKAHRNERPEWLQAYIHSAEKRQALYKRTLGIVILAQIFGGAGLSAGVTVGALLAQEMLGTDRLAGLPMALITLGSALAAYGVGWLSQHHSRRLGLSVGFLTGGLGAVGVVAATYLNNIFLLFTSLFLYGAGTSTNLQVRYAGTDLAQEKQRGTAISMALVFTTLGAVAGPNLTEATGDIAEAMGISPLAGPFLLGAVAYSLAGLVFFAFLRPDPLLVAKAVAQHQQADGARDKAQVEQPINKRGIYFGAACMILSQAVMVAIMTMTPIHMEHHGHALGSIGFVVSVHIAAMYLPSLITGVLVDKWGRAFMAAASALTLLAAGVLAAFAPGHSVILLAIALALLGLGWNFGLISGTALLVDATPVAVRAKTQGTVDVLVALAGSSGGALSGMIVAHSSYATLSLVGGGLALLLIPVVVWLVKHKEH